MKIIWYIYGYIRLVLMVCALGTAATAQTSAQQGVLTDPDWQFAAQKLLLQGEWQVVWGELVEPQNFDARYKGEYFALPNNWNDANNPAMNGAYGVATFRLKLDLPSYDKPLSFHIVSPNSAWKFYLDDELLGGNGVVSTDANKIETHYISRIFTGKDGDSQIVLQVANFSHAYGGAEYAIELWDAAAHKQRLDLMSLLFSIALGILFSIGLIHMVFYLADRKHRQQGPVHLWFSILCFILVYRISGIVPFFHIYSLDSFYWASLTPTYMSLYAAPAVYLLFFRALFPVQFPTKLTLYVIGLSVGFMLLSLLTPQSIYTQTKFFAIGLNIFVIAYSLYFTGLALRAKQLGAAAILVANFLFFLTAIHDGIIYSLADVGFDMTPFGFVLLGLGYSYALLVRLQHTFDEARDTSQELEILNVELEEKVTDRTKAFKLAAAKAENSAFEKAQFIAAASHDLRQPLHALALFNLALRRQVVEPKIALVVAKQGAAIENLGILLQDTLDASRVDSMRRKPEFTSLDVAELAARLWSGFHIRAESQNIKLVMDVDQGRIVSDATMLQRILNNLIDNGLKAARKSLKVSAKIQGDDWLFEIKDDGAGIAEQDVQRIFESYISLEEGEPNEAGGYGLGLYVVNEFSKLLGGKINIKTSSETGSCFSICFHQAVDRDHEATTEPQVDNLNAANFNLKILTIDDEVEILHGMHAILENWGCESLTASGLDTARIKLSAGRLPDLLIVDYHLHGSTGVKLIEKLRHEFAANLPAIIISGATQATILQQIQQAGLAFLPKPINATRLAQVLHKIKQNSDAKQAQL